jgi:hypothetical protein
VNSKNLFPGQVAVSVTLTSETEKTKETKRKKEKETKGIESKREGGKGEEEEHETPLVFLMSDQRTQCNSSLQKKIFFVNGFFRIWLYSLATKQPGFERSQ